MPYSISKAQLKRLIKIRKSFVNMDDKAKMMCPIRINKDACKLCRDINKECTCNLHKYMSSHKPCPCSIKSITIRMHKQRLKAWIIFNGGSV